jgi:putative ABC transport system permease protein
MSLLQDVKFAVRILLREPLFTAVMVIALALGIGVNTTVFTLVNAVLLRGLPFEQPDRIMYLSTSNHSKNQRDMGMSYPDFRDWRAQSITFKGMSAWSPRPMVITDDVSAPERYGGPMVTANLFSLIGQKPMLGRDFLPDEDKAGAQAVCIIGYGLWETRYGHDPNILGKSIRVNDVPTSIVGVMPKGMKFPINADLWIPLVPTAEFEKREARNLQSFGRLADAVSLASARNELETLAQRLAKAYPKSNQGVTPLVITFNDEFNGGPIRTVFLALLGAVGFVLLIACANVANMLLARSLARSREVSIRTALGASRWRVMRQLLVESVLVGIAGGLVGLAIAVWGVRMFDLAVANVGKPYWIVFRMDFTVFAYLAGICILTGVLFGLAPAIQLSKVDVNATLKEGGRGTSSGSRSRYLSASLVVFEVALSIVLLVGAGLMIRSFLNIYGLTDRLNGDRYLIMRLDLPEKRYPNAAARLRFYERLEQRLTSAPGVESAALVSHLPLSGAYNWKFEMEGKSQVEEDKQPSVRAVTTSPAYFRTARIALLRGRSFEDSDGGPDKAVVIVNQRFAAKYWPGQDPMGKRIRVLWEGDRPWLSVIGVSQDALQTNPQQQELDPLIYLPYRAQPLRGVSILVRAAVNPTSLTSAIRKDIQSIDSDLPAFGVMTLQANFEQQRWPFRVFGSLFAIFALIALLLSSVGLYAMMAYSVSQRRQEIGVRIAMGASGSKILFLILSQGMIQLGIGLAVGLAGAFGLARVLKTLLVQVSPTDPTTFVTISAVLVVIGMFACWLPARSAMKVDPIVALRYE